MAAMSAMQHAQQLGRVRAPRPTYGYYRQPNGWITVSPATDSDELAYRRDGWTPLTRYGRVEMTTQYAANHPLETLFMRGGAHELSVEQIVEMALHLNSPLIPGCGMPLDQDHKGHRPECWEGAKPVVFPQLTEVPPGYPCNLCDRSPFPTERARDQHESVVHKEEKGQIRLGETLAGALKEGRSSERIEVATPAKAPAAAAPAPAVVALTVEDSAAEVAAVAPATPAASGLPYLCGFCGDGFRQTSQLRLHRKEVHAKKVASSG